MKRSEHIQGHGLAVVAALSQSVCLDASSNNSTSQIILHIQGF